MTLWIHASYIMDGSIFIAWKHFELRVLRFPYYPPPVTFYKVNAYCHHFFCKFYQPLCHVMSFLWSSYLVTPFYYFFSNNNDFFSVEFIILNRYVANVSVLLILRCIQASKRGVLFQNFNCSSMLALLIGACSSLIKDNSSRSVHCALLIHDCLN